MDIEHKTLTALVTSAERVIDKNGLIRVNGKVASIRTVEFSRQVVRESCRRLHTLGYYIIDINSLKEKHIDALVRDWHEKGLSNKTMQNQLSRLRIFAGWLGKLEIIKAGGLPAYLPEVEKATLKVKTFTETSKSWTGNGVNLVSVLKQARLEDLRLYSMLLLGVSFGLRKKEMLRIKPWRADAGNELRIDGSVAKNGWPELTYKQSENRFYKLMIKLGITKIDSGVSAHGLRAEFAENLSLIMGLVPPSLGGEIDQMAKDQRKAITDAVSDQLGHDMEHTISAYFSSFRPVAHVNGIGRQIGSTLIVDSDKDIFATVNVNPVPVRSAEGGYRIQTKNERSQTTITCVLEVPWVEHEHMDVAAFVERFPRLSEKVRRILVMAGLGE